MIRTSTSVSHLCHTLAGFRNGLQNWDHNLKTVFWGPPIYFIYLGVTEGVMDTVGNSLPNLVEVHACSICPKLAPLIFIYLDLRMVVCTTPRTCL